MSEKHNCYGCGQEVNADEAVFALENGLLTTGYGDLYCDECLPPEPKKECKHCGTKFKDAEDDLNAVVIHFAHGTQFVGFICKNCAKNPVTGNELEM